MSSVITVADDDATGHASMCQHRHQLCFRACFQSQRFARMNQGLNYAAVLVNFDRINKEVIAVIAVGFRARLNAALMERKRYAKYWETEQCRQTLTLCFTSLPLTAQIDASFRDVRVRAHADVAQLVNVIVVIAPPGNIVSRGILLASRN